MTDFEEIENWSRDDKSKNKKTDKSKAKSNDKKTDKSKVKSSEKAKISEKSRVSEKKTVHIDEGSSSKAKWLIPLLLLIALGGGLFWFLNNRDDSSKTATEVTTQEEDTNGSSDNDKDNDSIVSLKLDLAAGSGDENNSGTAELNFNTDTGEICYKLNTDSFEGPSRSHIHKGGSDVVGGDIVLELGEQETYPAEGCTSEDDDIENDLNNIKAVLADPANYYLEMHSPPNEDGDETDSVRSQMGTSTDGTKPVVGAYDPENGDAITVIEDGKIILQGNVADQKTADALLAEYDGVDLGDLELVDNLKVVAGSPPPTGKIDVSDAILFDTSSADLNTFEGSVLEDLAVLLKAKPDWGVSIVGHTDNRGSDVINLELSKQRADSVRNAFEKEGLDGDRFLTRGAGFRDPIATNDTEAGRAKNRRITFEITQG